MEQRASGNCLNTKGLSDEKGFDFVHFNTREREIEVVGDQEKAKQRVNFHKLPPMTIKNNL